MIFQTINSVRSNDLSLKYHRFTPKDRKDIGISKFEFVAKTQFLSGKNRTFNFPYVKTTDILNIVP